MANPPIVIGPFTNVPAPGSPIKSDWPQSVSTYVDRRPRWIGSARASSTDQTGIGNADTDVTGLAVTFNQIAGRTMRAVANFNMKSTGGPFAGATVMIANVSNTALITETLTIPANTYLGVTLVYVFTVGATGSSTLKVRANAGGAGGTLEIINSFSRNGFLTVEDLGYPYP